MKKILLASLLVFYGFTLPMQAQLVKQKVGDDAKHQISLLAGINFPSFDIPHSIAPSAGVAYSYYFMPQIGIRGMLLYHYFNGEENTPSIYSHNIGVSVQGIFNFFSYQSGRREDAGFSIIPSKAYLVAGVGGLFNQGYSDGNTQESITTLSIPFGIGTRHAITRKWDMGIEASWHATASDNLEQMTILDSSNDSFGTLLFTGTYKIPKHDFSPRSSKQYKGRKKQKCNKRTGCAVAFD